jgi:hypothetical protein
MNRLSKAAGMLVGAFALATSAGAQAEEGVLMKDLLGSMGLISKDKPAIDYRERAPLVVPPRLELREPVRASAHARDPQWPNDPDVVARQRRQADARVPVTETERRRVEERPTLSIDEIRAGRRPGAEVPAAPAGRDNSARADTWVHPDQLRAQTRRVEEATGPEPARRSLAEPPTGLRAPAGGGKVITNFEPTVKEDEASPRLYDRQQAQRR